MALSRLPLEVQKRNEKILSTTIASASTTDSVVDFAALSIEERAGLIADRIAPWLQDLTDDARKGVVAGEHKPIQGYAQSLKVGMTMVRGYPVDHFNIREIVSTVPEKKQVLLISDAIRIATRRQRQASSDESAGSETHRVVLRLPLAVAG
jgi:hypothetical protein